MKCPHCLVDFHDAPNQVPLGSDVTAAWALVKRVCPSCGRFVLELLNGAGARSVDGTMHVVAVWDRFLAWPRAVSRAPLPAVVPPKFAEDYREGCLVLADSAKASAALSRRCLQNLLREVAKVKPGNLADEIQQVLDSGKLPSWIAESIDAVRNIGNFAAHPLKSSATGEVLPVEPGEAEWNLDVLESLFDFYFVQPALIKAKRDALDKKLAEAKKPPMK